MGLFRNRGKSFIKNNIYYDSNNNNNNNNERTITILRPSQKYLSGLNSLLMRTMGTYKLYRLINCQILHRVYNQINKYVIRI